MPINQTANLLAYFQKNAPASSQTTPINQITYPPIPATISTFSTDPLVNQTLVSIPAFSTSPLDGQTINAISTPFSTSPLTGETMPSISAFSTPPLDGQTINAIGTFSTAALSGMTINAIGSPFTTLPISGVSTINSPAAISPFAPQQFAAGVPGTMTYNDAYTTPNLPNTPITPFTTANTLLGLGQAVETPPNNMTPISALAAGDNSAWRGQDLSGPTITLGVVDYYSNAFANGFTTQFTPGTQTKFVGVEGSPGSLTYAKPQTPYDTMAMPNKNTYASKYSLDTRFAAIAELGSEINYTSHFNNTEGTDKITTLKALYEQSNYATQATRFDGRNVKPHVLRGIQMETPNYDRVDGIPDSAAEHKTRLELAIENSTWQGGWKERRKMLRNFQFQSRFQLGLGILPHLFLMGGPYNNKQDLKIKDEPGLLALASAKAWILGGTIARVPHHLTNYSMLNSLGIKYGFSPFGEKLYSMLGKLSGKLGFANEDLVPFYFKVLHKDTPPNKPLFSTSDTPEGILQFRGTLKTVNHSVTPQWSSKKYFGRPDSVYTYTGYSQNLSFSFQVYAPTRDDMVEMYENLNHLVDMCKPAWNTQKSYMKGPITELTIGNYMEDQPGFIASLSISPDEQIYWDLGKDPIKGLPQIAQVVPQGLIDSVPFIGANPKKLRTNRESLLEFPLKKASKVQGKVVPRAYNVSVTYTMIEKETPDANSARRTWDYTPGVI